MLHSLTSFARYIALHYTKITIQYLLVSLDVFYFPRPNKRHIYATPLRSSYFVWLHYKRSFPQSIPLMWLCLSVLQFVPRPDNTLVSVCITGTESILMINVVQKSTCLNWMEQHISSPTHSKCLYLSFIQSRHVLLETTQFRYMYLPEWQACKNSFSIPDIISFHLISVP